MPASARAWARCRDPSHTSPFHARLGDFVTRSPLTNRVGHPWVTLGIDVASRVYVGLSVTLADGGNANTESAFTAIADMLLGRVYEDGTFIGGMPEWIRIDQGSDFMNGVADAIEMLGGKCQPVEANTPQHKPYVERAIGTIKRRVLPRLPGYGERLDASGKASVPDSKLLTVGELANVFDRELRELNARRHRGINAVPLDVYRAGPNAAHQVEPRHIEMALLRRNRTAMVRKNGVTFNGIAYQGEATFAHIGETVSCGYLETRPDFLVIFDATDGRWLGRLSPASEASSAFARAVVEGRRRQIETVERAERMAGDLREEFLPQLRGGVVEVPGASPVPQGTDRHRRAGSAPVTPARVMDDSWFWRGGDGK